jgi:hypothetical protein
VALLREGIRPHGQWSHAFVQAQLTGLLINQHKRYDRVIQFSVHWHQERRSPRPLEHRRDFDGRSGDL